MADDASASGRVADQMQESAPAKSRGSLRRLFVAADDAHTHHDRQLRTKANRSMNSTSNLPVSPGRLLRRREVEQETGLSRTSIYRLMDQGQFPRPLRTGARAVAWPTAAIEAWKASRPTAMPGEM